MYRLRARGTPQAEWPRPADLPEAVYRLLLRRGIASVAEAERFLQPEAAPLHDPLLFPGVREAAARLREVIAAEQKICVWGDYDVDGVCASALLSEALERLGGRVKVHIPLREEEGYGLNEAAVRAIAAENTALLITVDCGISDRANVAAAREAGMDVIVTDHHRAAAEHLPDCLIVSAQVGDYPCPHLCGAGVAFKLACALDPRFEEDYIDLAALATVADIVPLTEENRTIVALGLARINSGARPGLLALLQEAGSEGRRVTEETLGFQIGPRLNAAGRLGNARRAFSLLRARTPVEAAPLAAELNRENSARRALEKQIVSEAGEMLRHYDFTARRAIVLRKEGWNPGVIGIAASRILERAHFPVLLFSEENGLLRGSCRSIPGVDIYLALRACERYFIRFGGHAAAAGITMEAAQFEPFCAALDAYLRENIPPETYIPVYEYDIEVTLDEMDVAACVAIDRLRPFGPGNPAPQLLARCRAAGVRRIGADGSHLRFWLGDGGDRQIEAVWFGQGEREESLNGELVVLGSLEKNVFRERVSAQFLVRAVLPADPAGAGAQFAQAVEPTFLTELLYTEENSGEPPTLTVAEAAALLGENLQGCVFAAAAPEAAAAACRELAGAGAPWIPDVVFGRWTEDARCFSAAAVCPAGDPPAGLRYVVALDLPAALLAPRLAERKIALYRLEGFDRQPNWLDTLPDIDALREIYSAAKRLASRPLFAHGRSDIARETAREADLAPHTAWAGLAVLEDMGLLRVRKHPAAIEMAPLRRADPRENRIYRNIERIKQRRRQK